MQSPTVATYPSAGGRRVTRGMRVPQKEYARSRHQPLFEENIGNQNEDIISASLDSDDDYEEDEDEEEDSLIEINLPSSHFSDLIEDPKQKLQSKLSDSIFKQQGLMEFLADINDMIEDENLIEIDISMGSINNPDFRLKQELAYFQDE